MHTHTRTHSAPPPRLAYLTNKCYGDGDLEYYIMEAGHIMGLKLPDDFNAKAVLSEVFKRITQWKMGSMGPGGVEAAGGPDASLAPHYDQFEL